MRNNSFSNAKGTILDKILQRWRSDNVSKYIKDNSVVCDLGCGFEAVFLKNIEKKIAKGVGLDIEVNLDFQEGRIELKKANLNTVLPLEKNFADVVVSLAVVEHLENYKKYITEAHRILRPSGIFIVTTPDPKGKMILDVLCRLKLISQDEINDHKRYFTTMQLKKLMLDAGFLNVKHKKFQFGFNNLFIAKK